MKEINRTQVLETLEKALRDAIECEDTLTFSVAIDGDTGEAYEWDCVCPLDCPESVYKGKDVQLVRFESEKYSTFMLDDQADLISVFREEIAPEDWPEFDSLKNQENICELVKQRWPVSYEKVEEESIEMIIEDENLEEYIDKALDND